MQVAYHADFYSYAGFERYDTVSHNFKFSIEFLIESFFQTLRDVHYENFRAQCISQIAQQGLRQERGKLKRDSISSQNDSSITETDRLLLQKDEEVKFWHFNKFFVNFLIVSLDSTNARYVDTNAGKIKNNSFNGPQKGNNYRCLSQIYPQNSQKKRL